ncbi:MAG: glycosyltransferase family 2 protein [Verrucomicrobia bacterium]|nr:glycosyltransferase family 2 protein [Verrucomicrobiota bacterium]
MTPSSYSLSVIVPVYNEAQLLPPMMAVLRPFLDSRFHDWEVILVESGSRDGSRATCQALAAADSRVRAVHEAQRNGFGSALKLGFQQATKDLVLMTTADQPFPLESIDAALPYLSNCDCVLSYRSVDPRKSSFRKVQSAVYNLLARLLLGLKVRHVNSAFKLYKRSVIQPLKLVSNGWFIDGEIVYWITRKKIRYAEIPVELTDRQQGTSTVKLTTAFAVLKELWAFSRSIRR